MRFLTVFIFSLALSFPSFANNPDKISINTMDCPVHLRTVTEKYCHENEPLEKFYEDKVLEKALLSVLNGRIVIEIPLMECTRSINHESCWNCKAQLILSDYSECMKRKKHPPIPWH